ncbi:MAG: fibronectin type III domain-containing protein, partial [Proteobacteria bacterium]|nr:fibronectin type III domain-containing protein [Pseudomonadota bacterium]
TDAQSLAIGTERLGPDGSTLALEYANGSSGFKIWREKSGNRILNATGLVANGWQKQLTRAGTAFSATDFTSSTYIGQIAGRVCPTHVFLSHSVMTATGRCLYYDSGNAAQTLDAAGTSGTEAEDWLQTWNRPATGRGTSSSYFEGNIKTCADKGMRLPTVYETGMTYDESWMADYLPTGDGISTPTWAGSENGVPSHSSYTWTASSSHYFTGSHWGWSGTDSFGIYYGDSRSVRCVLPSSLELDTPGAPTSVSGTAGNTQVALTWSAPASNGGASITDYVVQYSSDSGSTWTTFADGTSASTSATVTGLTNGTAYIFRVAATNSAGTGSESSNSASVTPVTPATTPDAPTSVSGTAGNTQVSLTWSAPASNGGASITDYVV